MLDLNNSQYFNTLPALVRESIWQSGTDFESEDEMRRFVANLQTGGEALG